MFIINTDLALEARELATASKGEVTGVRATSSKRGGVSITKLVIENDIGESIMKRPRGTYYTAEVEDAPQEGEDSFEPVVKAIGSLIAELVPKGDCMVVGLGNVGVTPDALGPKTAESVLVTRHVTTSGSGYSSLFRPVTVLRPGVLGQTGVESAEIVSGVAKAVRPSSIIAIDALAARRLNRLGRTVQITNTGIHPGAGIGNHRQVISEQTMGVPVIGIGVPTVISAATMIGDAASEVVRQPSSGLNFSKYKDLFVTTRDIDTLIDRMALLLGFAVNSALQSGLSIDDMRYYGC